MTVGCDLKPIYDADGNQYHALNILDFATTFQVLALLDNCSAAECAEKFWLWWVIWAGPPRTLVTDMGSSFLAAFVTLAERYSATSRVVPTEAPWQVGMIERHGGVLNDVINMTVAQTGAKGKTEMMLIVIASAAAKNRRPGLSGHSPRSAVFGMEDRLDGSVIDSLLDGEQLPAHSQAASDAGYQRALHIRQEAMKSIIDLDHSQRYHRAIAARPDLRGHQTFLPGATVYYWQAQGAPHKMKGRRRRQQDRWRGPGTVIGNEIRDGQKTDALWISHGGYLRLIAPQHVRPASPEEQVSEHDAMRRLRAIMEDFAKSQMEFENLLGQEDPPRQQGPGDIFIPVPPTRTRPTIQEEGDLPEEDEQRDERSRDDIERELFGDDMQDDAQQQHPSPEGPPRAYGPPEEINVLRLKPTQKSKKGKELNARLFDNDEWEAFMKADADNWAKHLKHNAVTVLTPEKVRKIPKENILPIVSRFVRTNKSDEPGVLEASSRLVVPGHLQDGAPQEEGGERTDAPTVPQLGLHQTLSIAASKGWTIKSFDVSSAFLRGDNMDTQLYFRPPKEGLPGVAPGSLIKAEKGVFGLRVAPRLWFKKAKAILESAGFRALHSLPGMFVLRIKGILKGILMLHVDDGLHCGQGSEYEEAMKKIHEAFEIAPDKQHVGNFTFLGRKLEQQLDHSVHVSQPNYLDEVKPIYVPKNRRATGDNPVTSSEKTELMSLGGQLAWIARETMPQIAYEVSNLQQRFSEAKVSDLVNGNTILRRAKSMAKSNVLKFIPLNLKDMCFVSIADASFAGQPRGGSQMGYAILLSTSPILDGSSKAVMLEWGSKKIHRVVRSTLAAEAAAMSFAFDRAFFARAVMQEILYGRSQHFREVAPNVPLALQLTADSDLMESLDGKMGLGTDCKSLYDLCCRPTSMPTEKRITLDLLDVRQHLDNLPDLHHVRWIPTTAMLVDALTKHLPDQTIITQFLHDNVYSLREDPRLEEQRVAARTARKAKAKAKATGSTTTPTTR